MDKVMEERKKRMKKLVRKIQKNFRGFYLAGGTALMLKYLHRISQDIDLFKKEPFSFTRLALKIRKLFKFPTQSFEIYLGAVFSLEDYPEVDEETVKIINEVKEKWIK